jgi:hypothetical protein
LRKAEKKNKKQNAIDTVFWIKRFSICGWLNIILKTKANSKSRITYCYIK